jgi:hypothetical protein
MEPSSRLAPIRCALARLIRSKGSTHDALGQVIIKDAMQDRLPDWNSGSAPHRMASGSSARGENPSSSAISYGGLLADREPAFTRGPPD